MTGRFDHEGERAELRRLIAHYDERASHYEYEYQMSGIPSQERAWMRNQRMADSLRAALEGKDDRDALMELKNRVMELDVKMDPFSLVMRVERLQKRISEGEF